MGTQFQCHQILIFCTSVAAKVDNVLRNLAKNGRAKSKHSDHTFSIHNGLYIAGFSHEIMQPIELKFNMKMSGITSILKWKKI